MGFGPGRLALVAAPCLASGFEAPQSLTTRVAPRRLFETTTTSEGIASAVAGTTIGVLGSVVAIEMKKIKIQKSKDCPYCSGTGNLMCACCFGAGVVDGAPCESCRGMGAHACENCKGRGRFIPQFLDSRASRDPETAAEDIGLL